MSEASLCLLEDLGVLHFGGPDAAKFLQGQLSNDVTALAPGALLRAGLHNPQGRTLALLALAAWAADEILALLPHELLASVRATLARYVLRSKVTIRDASSEHRIYGVANPSPPMRSRPGFYSYDGARALLIARADEPEALGASLTRTRWRELDVAQGLPQLYLPTSGQFVAQMLNLDCIGAISFSKGCYTGQEVIARAHYRGRVKRRMQRFVSATPLRLAPGDSGQLADGRGFRVIEAAQRGDGHSEFLAVAPLHAAEEANAEAGGDAPPGLPRIEVTMLPLPYELPE